MKRENKGLREKLKGTNAEEIQKLGWKIQGSDSAMGEIKCMREKTKCEGENRGLREEIKGTEAEEDNENFRREIKRCR